MNHTRDNLIRAVRPARWLLLSAWIVLAWSQAAIADPSASPYFGEPILDSDSPLLSGERPPGGAPTLRKGGRRRAANSADLDSYFEVPGGGYGVMGRIGHVAGETVGRNDSLTHINLQPYLFVEQNMLFSDMRVYRLNDGNVGYNLGAGWRRYLEDHDAIIGAVGYYDADDTRAQLFEQLGLSLELLTRWLDVRANWYIPIGDTEQILGTSFVPGSQRFEGNFLLFDTVTSFGNAAEGADVTATVPIPWKKLAPYNVEASGGFYHYQVRDQKLDSLWGYRMRLDASFFKRMLHTFVEVTNDRQHDTSVVFGASLDYYGGFEPKTRVNDRQFYRMSEFVRRNYNVVTIQADQLNVGVPVVNPDTGAPYFFSFIANNPPVGGPPDGTVENPFLLINDAFALAPASDVYLAFGGSTFTGADATIVVPDGKILLGEGVTNTLPSAGFGTVTLPVNRPGIVTLDQADGSAITAGNDVLVGGFTIIDPAINGVNVSGVMDGQFRDLTILGADDDGILIQNATGTFRFDEVTVAADDGIDGAGGIAFHVIGGSANITVSDDASDVNLSPTFENSGGNINEVILIENTTGGFVNMANTSAVDDGGEGIDVLNTFGGVTLGDANLMNTVGNGVEINNANGNTTLSGDITVDNASGIGLQVTDIPGIVVNGGNITITNPNDIGANFFDISGEVRSTPTSSLTVGPRTIAGAMIDDGLADPGLVFSGSSGSVVLNNITIDGSVRDAAAPTVVIDGSQAEGILIGDPTGANVNALGSSFTATGATTIRNIGNIGNVVAAQNPSSIRIEGAVGTPDQTRVDFRDTVNISARRGQGIHIENTMGTLVRPDIAFSGTTTVNNDFASGFSALSILNNETNVSFDTFIANDAVLDESGVDIVNTAAVGFDLINIDNAVGTGQPLPIAGLRVNNVPVFSTSDGRIDVQDETAINIVNVGNNVTLNGQQVILTEVNSINPNITPEVGIRLINNSGQFTITGDGANFTSGGTISGIGVGSNPGLLDGNFANDLNGLYAFDADEVTIRFQDYIGNDRGLVFEDMNEDDTQGFTLSFLQVQDSTAEGVLSRNVRNITIEDSLFQNNGAVDLTPTLNRVTHSDTIRLTVNELIDDPTDLTDQDNPQNFPYTYTVQRNVFLDTNILQGADGVSIATTGGAASGARVDLFFLDNTFSFFDRVQNTTGGAADFPALLVVGWDGIVNAEIRRNVGNLGDGTGQAGFAINQTSNDDLVPSRVNIVNNQLTFGDGPNLTGADLRFVGRAQMTIDNNLFTFNSNDLGTDALLFRLLSLNNQVDITDNTFLFNGGGTGVNVQIVGDNSGFFIEGNQIGAGGALADRGFRFGTILGTANLFGTAVNDVSLVNPIFANFFSVGAGATNGQFNINGTFVP